MNHDYSNEDIMKLLQVVKQQLTTCNEALSKLSTDDTGDLQESIDKLYIGTHSRKSEEILDNLSRIILWMFLSKLDNTVDRLEEIIRFQRHIKYILASSWCDDKTREHLVELVKKDLQEEYECVTWLIGKKITNHPGKYTVIELEPICPWTLEELLETSADDLMMKIIIKE